MKFFFFLLAQYSIVPADTTFMLPKNQSRIKGVVVSKRGEKNVKWAEFDCKDSTF